MPTILISNETQQRLLHHLVSFDDTADAVIGRVLDAFEAGSNSHTPSLRNMDPDAPDDLSHTRLIRASFGGIEINRPNWGKLVRKAHSDAKKHLSFRDLEKLTIAHIREGKYEDQGFSYIPEADLSIQGLPANNAWQSILKLARHLKVSVRLVVEWHDKEKASHPGERAALEWSP